jgi:hypothetical protein
MKANVAILGGTVAAPGLEFSRANVSKQNRQLQRRRNAEVPRVRPRPALVMIWRTNPTSGRLECRWSLERSAQTDEGVNCNHPLQRAA